MTGASASQLQDCLREHGLFVRGITRLSPAEIETYGLDADKSEIALVGNIGSSYWPVFSQSAEFGDGAAHPLDRWSRRIAGVIAESLSLRALFPFDGPPWYPFQQWAARAEGLLQSPIGVMIHPEYGLWHSYRFALLGTAFEPQPSPVSNDSPCIGCIARPCLHTCPVGAFDDAGYDFERCADYLLQTPGAECNRQGCLARYACPVAPEFRYVAAQGQFHLQAFLSAQQSSK